MAKLYLDGIELERLLQAEGYDDDEWLDEDEENFYDDDEYLEDWAEEDYDDEDWLDGEDWLTEEERE